MKKTIKALCPYCQEAFYADEKRQMCGFRWKESLYCPHCNELILESMEFEWSNVRKKL